MKILKTILGFVSLSIASVEASVCNVLALSGGGAFGAVEMGVLDGLVSSKNAPKIYDIVTGISAGGLNTGFLSYYDSVDVALPEIHSIYANLTTPDVYKSDILGIFTRWSLYDNTPLENTLKSILLNKVPSSNPPLSMIGATNLNSSQLDVFIFGNKSFQEKIQILLSTSAIPFAFPPRNIGGNLYVDGGVISSELINQVLGQKPCDTYNITFINSHRKNGQNIPINGLFSYISAVLHTVDEAWSSQIAQITTCPYPKGTIHACYPTSTELDKYSILDFDNGSVLYSLGKQYHSCDTYPLC
jgi:hypothetical protein